MLGAEGDVAELFLRGPVVEERAGPFDDDGKRFPFLCGDTDLKIRLTEWRPLVFRHQAERIVFKLAGCYHLNDEMIRVDGSDDNSGRRHHVAEHVNGSKLRLHIHHHLVIQLFHDIVHFVLVLGWIFVVTFRRSRS